MQQGPQKRICRRCYFSRLLAGILHCVKNPPALDHRTGQARWPVVKDNDICGYFRFIDSEHIESDRWPKSDLPIYTDRFGDYCRIHLTRSQFAKVDPEDYIWLSQFRWHCKVNKCAIYAVRTINHAGKSKRIFMHRLIASTPSRLVCDHINHNGLDNRKQNLRNCTKQENGMNRPSQKNGTSRYKGVCWHRRMKKWVAYIKGKGKKRHLGYFISETSAAKAYDIAARKYHDEFASLNFAD
jgi:hypothetical protein